MTKQKKIDTKQLVVLALMAALAYAAVALFRIPVVQFLKYEPKDCILAIAGMLYGPLPALLVTVVVSLVEMVTISTTGIIGLVMNIVSSGLFVCTAAWIYQKNRTLRGALWGLILGALLMTGGMVLWNWLITPLYMSVPRQAVVEMLLPVFLPFNALKSGLNAALTVLLYKSVVTVLRKAHLTPARETAAPQQNQRHSWVIGAVVLVVLATVLVLWRVL